MRITKGTRAILTVAGLADDFFRDQRINQRKAVHTAELRWKLHLEPFFGQIPAKGLKSGELNRYIDQRLDDGASNATINRELSLLRRCFTLAYKADPPRVPRVPSFPKLKERNIRSGFLTDDKYDALAQRSAKVGLWLRAMLELGYSYGWRVSELRHMRVSQLDLMARSIRLNPGETKNDEGREVVMTEAVFQLLSQCAAKKQPDELVFTRGKQKLPIGDFRKIWYRVCKESGVPGLLFHDLRRSAARNLRSAGVPEGVIMKIGGWKTRSIFERYAIVSNAEMRDAIDRLIAHRATCA
jgi:integrase